MSSSTLSYFSSLIPYAKSRNKETHAFEGDRARLPISIDRSIDHADQHVYECVYDLIVVVSGDAVKPKERRAYN